MRFCGNCVIRLDEYEKIAKVGLRYVYTVCSAICSVSSSPRKVINLSESFISCNGHVYIVSTLPENELCSKENDYDIKNENMVRLLINAFETVAMTSMDDKLAEVYEESKEIIDKHGMHKASVHYHGLSINMGAYYPL